MYPPPHMTRDMQYRQKMIPTEAFYILVPGTIPAELVLRQVGSQSERPLGIERKVGRIDSLSRDMTTPLWDILRESIPVPSVGTTDAPPPSQRGGTEHKGAERVGQPAEVARGGGASASPGAYLSSLTRRQLQALAKQYGVKANLKSQDIVEQLLKSQEVVDQLLLKGEQPLLLKPLGADQGSGRGIGDAVLAGGAVAVGQRAVFLRMMVERVWQFRNEQDPAALLPLLDAGAQVTEGERVAWRDCLYTHGETASSHTRTHTHTHTCQPATACY